MVNHLVDQSSPYLQQHVNNPVDWYPYREDAFEKAKIENKLIFLSIGYSACHWCHVMAHESFEDASIAQFLNEYFVAIKVDREERPDVDQIYQTMIQAMGKQGGWPLSIFLTPDGKPIFGGTYFPKTPRYGMISFLELLKTIHQKYFDEKEKVSDSGDKVLEALDHIYEHRLTQSDSDHLKKFPFPQEFTTIVNKLLKEFDLVEGGLAGAPKFPPFILLTFLLRQLMEDSMKDHQRKDEIEHVIETTLDKMLMGGIYDQIGGGFHRYSVDQHWIVPHFEKMLYDNALALVIYSEAYLYFRNPLYKEVVLEIISWLEREMKHSTGLFYSSMDADVNQKEGEYYLWEFSDFESLSSHFSEFDRNMMLNFFGISLQGNFEQSKNILTLSKTLSELAKEYGLSEDEILTKLKYFKKELLSIRNNREKPSIDEKIIVSWNSLLLHGLLAARKVFPHEIKGESILELVLNNSKFFREKMLDPVTGRLYRIYRHGEAKIPGMLNDYAYFIQALLDEFDITHNAEVLSTIEKLIQYVNQHFWDEKKEIYYFIEDISTDVPVKPQVLYDTPIPNGNAVMAENLLRFYYYFSSNEGLERADAILKTLTPHALRSPTHFGSYFLAVQCNVYGGTDISIIHPNHQEDPVEVNIFRGILSDYYIPRLHVYEGKSCPKNPKQCAIDNKPTFYYCQGFECLPPTTDPREFRNIIERFHLRRD